MAQIEYLSARLMEGGRAGGESAIYGLNRASGRTREPGRGLDHSRPGARGRHEPGRSGGVIGTAQELGMRRLALIERLGAKAREELRVGLLTPTAARQMVRLPQGNQAKCSMRCGAEAIDRRTGGGGRPVAGLQPAESATVYSGAPREALSQAKGATPAGRDPRLSDAGNQVWKRVGLLLDVLGRMEVWLAHHGRAGLTAEDRAILAPRFEKLSRDATSVGALSLIWSTR